MKIPLLIACSMLFLACDATGPKVGDELISSNSNSTVVNGGGKISGRSSQAASSGSLSSIANSSSAVQIFHSYDSLFVLVPAGSFVRSDGQKVRVAEFWITKTEIPQWLYRAIMGADIKFNAEAAHMPVSEVTWMDAARFCNAFSDTLGMGLVYRNFDSVQGAAETRYAVRGLRLPTEAEWEYAARAGSTDMYAWGSQVEGEIPSLFTHVGVLGAALDVAFYQPNEYGLFDMQGNLWEWVNDYYANWSLGKELSDPTGPENGTQRVLRGGGYLNTLAERSFALENRKGDLATKRAPDRGFRIVYKP